MGFRKYAGGEGSEPLPNRLTNKLRNAMRKLGSDSASELPDNPLDLLEDAEKEENDNKD